MKRCPQCSRVESDETLKFCRNDGAVLVEEASVSDQFSATRVLTSSPTGGTQVVHTDPGHAEVITAGLKPAKEPKVQPGELTSTGHVGVSDSFVTRLKRHRTSAIVIAALVIVVGIVFFYFYEARSSNPAIDSIAVLPFVNQNRDPDTEYLSDGLTESIINSLAQLSSLRVSPRSTVFQYKGKDSDPLKVGHDLGVRAVLTGRLQQRGDSLFVSAELLDVRNNKQVWGEQYNRKIADALAVQQEISREISERLRTKLSGEEQRQLTRRDTNNPEAYGFYLKGRYYWEKRTGQNLKKAVDQFQQAADKDPNYALAYVGLADCYLLLEDYVGAPASEAYPKAEAFAERALKLDSSLAEAHSSLAYAYTNLWQWKEAEEEFKRAIQLNPNYPTAHHWNSLYLLDQGRNAAAIAAIKRARELDPLSPIIGTTLNYAYFAEGDVDSAVAQCKSVIDLDPNFARAHEYLGLAYLRQGHHADAMVELQKAVELSGRDRRALRDLGYGYAVSGKRAEALNVLKEVEGRYAKHEAIGQDLTAVYAGLGD